MGIIMNLSSYIIQTILNLDDIRFKVQHGIAGKKKNNCYVRIRFGYPNVIINEYLWC